MTQGEPTRMRVSIHPNCPQIGYFMCGWCIVCVGYVGLGTIGFVILHITYPSKKGDFYLQNSTTNMHSKKGDLSTKNIVLQRCIEDPCPKPRRPPKRKVLQRIRPTSKKGNLTTQYTNRSIKNSLPKRVPY